MTNLLKANCMNSQKADQTDLNLKAPNKKWPAASREKVCQVLNSPGKPLLPRLIPLISASFFFLIFLNNNAEHVVLQIITDLASVLCRNSFDN